MDVRQVIVPQIALGLAAVNLQEGGFRRGCRTIAAHRKVPFLTAEPAAKSQASKGWLSKGGGNIFGPNPGLQNGAVPNC